MSKRILWSLGCGFSSLAFAGHAVLADLIHESAMLGPTGGEGGWAVSDTQFIGSRFHIDFPAEVTALGGHLNLWGNEEIFAVIVALNGPDALPTGAPFSEHEVVTVTTFDPGYPSSDARAMVLVTLSPGDYALIFGSGLFGATGTAGLPANNLDLFGSSYFVWNGSAWVDGGVDSVRFVVEGRILSDTDDDGVADRDDVCCNTPTGVAVNNDGRPIGDLDGDCDVDVQDFAFVQDNFTGPLVDDGPCPCADDIDCDDLALCTIDRCVDGLCVNTPVDCDDGLFCTGVETCDPGTGNCLSRGNPCATGWICDDEADECARCVVDKECDDRDNCTNDTCANGTCDNTPVNCPQGAACNPANGHCEDIACTSDADCDDGLSCTTNSCNTGTGECIFFNVHALCHDGLFCTGDDAGDVCDPTDEDAGADGCVRGGDPCCCDAPICDEANDECDGCGDDDDCDDGATCTTDNCEGDGSCTNTPVHVLCDDDLFCTDDDFCDPENDDADPTTGCVNETDPCDCGHPSNPCGFTSVAGFFEERMLCNEADDTCDSCTGNQDCDDGIACTADTCDGVSGICTSESDSDNCPNPDFCDGEDYCDPNDEDADANGCVQPGDACSNPTPICDESDDECNGCVSNAECDDGVDCTDDACDGLTGACDNADNCGLLTCNMTTGQCE